MEITGHKKFVPDYESMMKSGMHFGRKKTIFHPNMKPYVHAVKENICILDLVKTGDALGKAIKKMASTIEDGKMILFVGTTKQSSDIVKDVAMSLGMPYINHRWLGGTLTNFKVIVSRARHMEALEKEKADGGFDKYTKKERMLKEREISSLNQKYDGLRKLSKLPEVVFVSSLKENTIPIKECAIMKLKTIGIVNTDSDPKKITYPIPANDNSRKAIELIMETIKNNLVGVGVSSNSSK